VRLVARASLLALVLAGGCGGGSGGSDAAPGDGGGSDATVTADAGSLVTSACPSSYGPGNIAETFTVAPGTIGFDLDGAADPDGNGMIDNSIGTPDALRGIVNSSLNSSLDSGELRLLSELRDFGGLGADDPDMTIASYGGVDTDTPVFTTDDFSGEEPFYYSHESVVLDDCVPKALLHGSFTSGVVDATADRIGFDVTALGGFLTIDRARYQSTLEADTVGVRTPAGTPGVLGGAITSCSLNRAPGQITSFSLQYEITQLFTVQPDIDLDGDGIETIQTVAQEGVISCTDGDGTVIQGADCGCDPRIADGYSIAFSIDLRGATVLGPVP